jgi:hypothetical protein
VAALDGDFQADLVALVAKVCIVEAVVVAPAVLEAQEVNTVTD